MSAARSASSLTSIATPKISCAVHNHFLQLFQARAYLWVARQKVVAAPGYENGLLIFSAGHDPKAVVLEFEDSARSIERSRSRCEHCEVAVGNHRSGNVAVKGEHKVWRWRYTATDGPNCGKREETRYHLSESEAAAHYKDAEKIESTLEIRTPTGSTGDFLKSLPKSEPGTSTPSPGSSSDS